MSHRSLLRTLSPLGALALLVAFAPASTTTYRVAQSVGSLFTLDQNNFQYLDFSLADGTATGNGNTTVTVSDLRLSSGSFGATLPPDVGNVTVNPDGSFVLQDGPDSSQLLSDHAFSFTVSDATAVLSYTFTVDTASFETGAPDSFALRLLDENADVVPTLDPGGLERMLAFDLVDENSIPMGYAVDPTRAPSRFAALPAPAAVPEPAAYAALGMGVLGQLRRRRWI